MVDLNNEMHFILGSSSPRRLELLAQIGIIPNQIVSPKIEEKILKNELPLSYVKRIVTKKMSKVRKENPTSLILTADTIVHVGRRILNKTSELKEAESFLKILSGRRHKVTTAFIISSPSYKGKLNLVSSIVKFKVNSTRNRFLFKNK